jgi:hypothetical protein
LAVASKVPNAHLPAMTGLQTLADALMALLMRSPTPRDCHPMRAQPRLTLAAHKFLLDLVLR